LKQARPARRRAPPALLDPPQYLGQRAEELSRDVMATLPVTVEVCEDSIVIVCAGAVGLHLPGRAPPLLPVILLSRDSFGDNALLGDSRWAGVFGVDSDADLAVREDCKVVRVAVLRVDPAADRALPLF
jgi:hypothetical protein